MELQKYEPLIEIHMRDGEVYYVKASNRQAIEKDWKEKTPCIQINGETIATYDIRKIKEYTGSYNVTLVPQRFRSAVNQRIKEFTANIGRVPNDEEVRRITQRIINT